MRQRFWRCTDDASMNVYLRRACLQAGLRASPMRNQQLLSDTPPAEFRKQLHELADWIADFRANIDRLRVAPNDKPGAIREQLCKHAPEKGEPFEKILTDVDRIIVPGMTQFLPVHRDVSNYLEIIPITTKASSSARLSTA